MLGKFSSWCFSPLWLVICQWKKVWVVVNIVTGAGRGGCDWHLAVSTWPRGVGEDCGRDPLCLWSAGQWSSWQKVQWEVGCGLLSRDLQALRLVGEVGAWGQAGGCALQAPELLPGPGLEEMQTSPPSPPPRPKGGSSHPGSWSTKPFPY